MQYVDCNKAQKNGNLCLGYSEEIDEPCEICKNCIKCESGYYQLGETEKDDKIEQLKEQIEKMINEIDKCMCLSNMREREIYDIQEIFREYNFRRDSNDKWELKE